MGRLKNFYLLVCKLAKKFDYYANYDPAIVRIQKAIDKTKSNDPKVLKKKLKKMLSATTKIRDRKMEDASFLMKCYLFIFSGLTIRQAIWKLDKLPNNNNYSDSDSGESSVLHRIENNDSSKNFGSDNTISASDMFHGSDAFSNSASSQPMAGSSIDISGNLHGTTSSSSYDDYRY